MRRAARRSLLLGGALGALFLATVPLIPPLVTLTAGQKYAPAAPMAQMLLAGSAIGLAGFWMRPYYLASGAVRQFLVASVVAGGLAVLGFFVAAPRWEGMGVATVRVVCISVLPFALLFRGLRRLNADQPAPAVK
jgi:O-antigen/teichoic acid export membrane protein